MTGENEDQGAPRTSRGRSSLDAVADYLEETVKEGGTFTLNELRARASQATQADRRMRDLRQMGWRIETKRDDPSLPPGTYRVVTIGGRTSLRTLSDRVRREVLEKAKYRCQVCGYGANETYPDGGVVRLQIGHYVPKDQGGSETDPSNLRVECHRCNEGIRNKVGDIASPESVRVRVRDLNARRKRDLLGWIMSGRREPDAAERAYYDYQGLPPSEKAAIETELRRSLGLPE